MAAPVVVRVSVGKIYGYHVPEISKEHGRRRPGKDARQIDDANTTEWWWHDRSLGRRHGFETAMEANSGN